MWRDKRATYHSGGRGGRLFYSRCAARQTTERKSGRNSPRLRGTPQIPVLRPAMPLSTDLFDYVLPPHLVAQTPAARRDQSRLLVVDRVSRTLSHHIFSDLPQFLRTGDTLIRNNASVLPARLLAHRPTGGAVEEVQKGSMFNYKTFRHRLNQLVFAFRLARN